MALCAKIVFREDMPIYEFRCQSCGRRINVLRRWGDTEPPLCSHCGSSRVSRIFSTFLIHRTDREIYEDILSDSQLIKGLEQNDPRALAEWNRRLSRGEKVEPEYEELMYHLERGEMPPSEGPAAEEE